MYLENASRSPTTIVEFGPDSNVCCSDRMSLKGIVIGMLQITLTTVLGSCDLALGLNQVMFHGQLDCFSLTMDPELTKDFLEVIAYSGIADA